ncbi:MAG: CRISPR-associated ring nuclease Csm6 [Pseudomonadota bacterium]|nr:CRISPR-associated ring nuclease Csm6 [Pseudomonadota bacterium]
MPTTTHTLLATTGASPQVVTETLYAIHHENLQWPDDIYLITTSFGKKRAIEGLLHQHHLQRLCTQLNRPTPAFDGSHVLVTPGADGSAVEDARSLQDHEALANFIMTEVRNLTAQPRASLHASLAGGRKTMTFYLGYAMSLFGQAQDTLSHVLVSDGYETLPDFWFPTAESSIVKNSRGEEMDANLAKITLAPIPFIRHRFNLPKVLLQDNEVVQFSDLVQLINLGENLDSLRIVVDPPQKTIRVESTESQLSIPFQPGPLEMAFYSMMARGTREGEHDLTRPDKPDRGLSHELMRELMPICAQPYDDENLANNIAKLKDWNITNPSFKEDTFDVLATGITRSWFDSRKNTLVEMFSKKLPGSLVRRVAPSIIWSGSQRITPGDMTRVPKGGGYGIDIKPENIIIN